MSVLVKDESTVERLHAVIRESTIRVPSRPQRTSPEPVTSSPLVSSFVTEVEAKHQKLVKERLAEQERLRKLAELRRLHREAERRRRARAVYD